MSPERLDEDDAADLRAAAARIERAAPAFADRMRREADQMDANNAATIPNRQEP